MAARGGRGGAEEQGAEGTLQLGTKGGFDRAAIGVGGVVEDVDDLLNQEIDRGGSRIVIDESWRWIRTRMREPRVEQMSRLAATVLTGIAGIVTGGAHRITRVEDDRPRE